MLKPPLSKHELQSTIASRNLRTMTNPSTIHSIENRTLHTNRLPTATSFRNQAKKPTSSIPKNEIVQPKKPTTSAEKTWVDTSDIEAAIKRTMETDIESSTERNFGTEKYYLGQERVCTDKILPIPKQIVEALSESNQRPIQDRIHFVYGYLSRPNAVYYIVGQDLYIFGMDQLRQRNKEQSEGKRFVPRENRRTTKLRSHCQKIHQISFRLNQTGKSILNTDMSDILIMQYPYFLQFVTYTKARQQTPSSNHQPRINSNYLDLISLDLRTSIQTKFADFITITPESALIYLDENGRVNYFVYSKQDSKHGKHEKKRTFQQSRWMERKSNFMSRHRSFWKIVKQWTYTELNFTHSLSLPKRKNIAMIYDDKRSQIYTLTIKGDRSTIIQQLKKSIRIYSLNIDRDSVDIQCLWEMPEEDLLLEMEIPIDSSRIHLHTILKAEPQYNQDISFIALLSNGVKGYFEVTLQSIIKRWAFCPPEFDSLKKTIHKKKDDLSSMTSIPKLRLMQEQAQKWGGKLGISSEGKNSSQRLKAYHNDRGLTVSVMKLDKEVGIYMTMRRQSDKNDEFDVFRVNFTHTKIFKDLDNFPNENQIYPTKFGRYSQSQSQRLTALQQLQIDQQHHKLSSYRPPIPTSQNTHQLLRQLHHGPREFTYLSSNFITTFSLVRPIDILYFLVKSRKSEFCEMYLPSIMGVDPYEICCMLLHIYSAPQNTPFYIPSKYEKKIEDIVHQISHYTELTKSSRSDTMYSAFDVKRIVQKQRISLDEIDKEEDEMKDYVLKGTEDFNMKIRRLFVYFSRQQEFKNSNVFNKINLDIPKSKYSQDPEDNFNDLSEEQKIQVKHCQMYISRVVYPFWNAKSLTRSNRKQELQIIRRKIKNLQGVVNILKSQSIEYWKHLKAFQNKVLQLLEIFERIPRLPKNLSLSSAMSQPPSYFERFIFANLQTNVNQKMVLEYQHYCPMYISDDFVHLISIYHAIKEPLNSEQIKSILSRRLTYPDYFIEYVKHEKPYFDHTIMIERTDDNFKPQLLQIPQMPFQTLMPFFFDKVRAISTRIDVKFLYLREAHLKLESHEKEDMNVGEVVPRQYIDKFRKEYIQIFNCLKLQEQCKKIIEDILEEQAKAKLQEEHLQATSSSLIGTIASKTTQLLGFSSSQAEQKKFKQKQKLLKRKVHEESRQLFHMLDFIVMKKEDFWNLLQMLESPRLQILCDNVFSNKYGNLAEKEKVRQALERDYAHLVESGFRKFGNNLKAQSRDLMEVLKYDRLILFLKQQVKHIYVFLNSTKTPLQFVPLYRGLTSRLLQHNFTFFSLEQTIKPIKYSIPLQLVELGFSKQTIAEHMIYEELQPLFAAANISDSEVYKRKIKQWAYHWIMTVQMVRVYKREDATKLHRTGENFLKINKDILQKSQLQSYKRIIERQMAAIYNLVNQQQVEI